MKLTLEQDVLALFPAALIGVIVVRGCDNAGTLSAVERGLRQAEKAALGVFGGAGGVGEVGAVGEKARGAGEGSGRAMGGASRLGEEPRIACWREAYRQFGGSPKKNPSSIESLLRRVLKGETLRPINSLVDLYNAVSLERLLPAGGEDLDVVRGDVVLCRAGEGEPPVRLLGDAEARPPHAGEVIYRDDVSALCRRWNWKEAERTKLTAATRNALLVMEALPPSGRADLQAALADLAGRLTRHCGGEVRTAILDAAQPSMTLG